jgi:hypothetical protein
MLRRALLVLGGLGLVGAVFCLLIKAYVAALYLSLEAGVMVLGILFERWRYVAPRTAGAGSWQATGERFVDPTSGKLVEVYFNPDTGERDYRDTGGAG